MRKICLLVLFIGYLLNLQAQNCPSSISVTAPSSDVLTGTTCLFTVNISGLPGDISPTYNWSISSGTIVSGQGTSVITVDPGTEEGTCTATAEIGGLPAQCSRTASATAYIRKAPEEKTPEKILSTTVVTEKALQDAVKKFISKTKVNVSNTQMALVNIYTVNKQQFIKLKAIIEKAFDVNRMLSFQYTIVDAGVTKAAVVDMFLAESTY